MEYYIQERMGKYGYKDDKKKIDKEYLKP